MTSVIFRNDPLFLRNEFEVEGKWGFPIVRKQALDLDGIELIACSMSAVKIQRICTKEFISLWMIIGLKILTIILKML